MIKKITFFTILGLFVVVLAVNAQYSGTTQPQPGSSQDTAASAKDNTKSTGKVDKIDTLAKTIAVKVEPSGEVRVFTFDDKTTYEIKGKNVKVEKIKVGDEVEIESDAGNMILKLKIKPMKSTTDENPEKE